MKLLQLNAWGGKLSQQIINLIRDESPDFVCLQEIIGMPGDVMGFHATLEILQEACGYKNAFLSPVFSFAFMDKNAKFGNAILSKLPFKQQEAIFTHLDHQENFNFEMNDYNIRNFQHVVVGSGSKQINILNHHGYHVPDHKNGNEETLRQMKIIADYTTDLDGPIILTGDFNLAPHSKSLNLLNKILKNLSVEYKLKTTRNQFTHKTEVCDYIFVSNDVVVKNFRASDELVSDHKALIVEFEIE